MSHHDNHMERQLAKLKEAEIKVQSANQELANQKIGTIKMLVEYDMLDCIDLNMRKLKRYFPHAID